MVPGRGAARVYHHLRVGDLRIVETRSARKNDTRHTGVLGVDRRPAVGTEAAAHDVPTIGRTVIELPTPRYGKVACWNDDVRAVTGAARLAAVHAMAVSDNLWAGRTLIADSTAQAA